MSAPAPRSDRSSMDRVRAVLADRITQDKGDQLYARCPAPGHDDHNASLSVTWRITERGGRVFIRCHRDCSDEDVWSALGLALVDLYDTPPARPAAGKSRARTPSPRASRSTTRRPAATAATVAASTPAATPTGPELDSDPVQRPRRGRRPASEIESEHLYTDIAGEVVYTVVRWKSEPKYSVRRMTANGRWKPVAPPLPERVLYNAPAVVAAVAAGKPVYLVEGEKDADSMTAAGVTATSAPFGAPSIGKDGSFTVEGKWLPQYTALLTGAHVVIVVDNDPAEKRYTGQRYGLHIAAELDGKAASVRLVRAATGKDATDHLQAGHAITELVRLDRDELTALVAPADQAPAPAPAPADPTPEPEDPGRVVDMASERVRRGRAKSTDDQPGPGGNGGGGSPLKRAPIRRDKFDVVDGSLCQIKMETITGEDGKPVREETPIELINAAPRLVSRLRRELGDGGKSRVEHFDLEVSNADGESVILEALDDKEWSSCSWVHELPWPAVFDNTSNGRSKLQKGIAATSGPVPVETLYGRLGWWEIDGRWIYLHATGGIDANGPTNRVRVKVDKKYEPFWLPEPARQVDDLRAALEASLIEPMNSAIPDRLIAPMLCGAYRAVLGYSRVTLVPAGLRGSAKTGISAIGQQHFAPESDYKHLPFGAGEDAATLASLEEHRFIVGDMLQVLDDIAPDRGTESMGRRQSLLARSQAERRGKDRRMRDRAGVHPEHRPNGLLVITTEEWTGVDSAESRTVGLPHQVGEFDPEQTLGALDLGTRPAMRATLTATMAQHYASRMPLKHWIADTMATYRSEFREETSDPGVEARRAESFADLAVGARALLDMAVERRAFTLDEADYWWSRLWTALVEAKRAMSTDRDERRAHEVALELVRSAMLRKAVSVADKETGEAPEDGHIHGYEAVPGHGQYPLAETTWRRVGESIGYVDSEAYYLNPISTTSALAREARGGSITWPYTHSSLGAMLAQAGVIATEVEPSTGKRRNTVRTRIGSGQRAPQVRVWKLSRELLFPMDDDEGQDHEPDPTDTDAPPSTTPPPAVPPAGEGPADEPHQDTSTAVDGPTADLTEDAPEPAEKPAQNAVDARDPLSAGKPLTTPAESRSEAPRPYDAPAVVCAAAVGYLAKTDGSSAALFVPELPDGIEGLPALCTWADTDLKLGHASRRKARHSYGQLWLLPGMRKRVGLPARLPERERGAPESKTHTKIREALEAGGWQVAGKTGIAPWTTVYRPGGRRMVLVVPEWLATGTKVAAFGEDDPEVDAATLARRLGLYAAVTGIAHQWSPAVTGLQLVAATRPRLMQNDRPELPPPARRPELEHDYIWQRAPQPDERAKKYVHAIDKRAAYLGAAASLTLGYGAPRHVTAETDADLRFDLDRDREQPGYWRVRVPQFDHARLPDPLQVWGRGQRNTLWMTTPTLRTLVELYEVSGIEIREAFLWDRGENTDRIFEPWYESLRNALLALEAVKRLEPQERKAAFIKMNIKLDPATMRTLVDMTRGDVDAQQVLNAVKGNYRGGIGRLDADVNRDTTHRLWRPDFRHAIIAQSRYALTRKIVKAAEHGVYPLALVTDAYVWASDEADIEKALPPGFNLGWTLGSFKYEGTAPMDEVAPLLERGTRPLPTSHHEDGSVKQWGLLDTIRGNHRGGDDQ